MAHVNKNDRNYDVLFKSLDYSVGILDTYVRRQEQWLK